MGDGNKQARLRETATAKSRANAPRRPASTALAANIGYIVADTRRSILRILQSHMAAHNIPASFWPFLRALWVEDGISQRELGRRAGILDAATGAVVRNLEKNGYIVRARNKEDQRKILVYLTPAGRALEKILFPTITKATDVALNGFSKSEAQELIQFLLRMRTNLNEDQ